MTAVNGDSISSWIGRRTYVRKHYVWGRLVSELKYVAVPREDEHFVAHGLGSKGVCTFFPGLK